MIVILLVAGIWRYALPVMVEVAVAVTPPSSGSPMSQARLLARPHHAVADPPAGGAAGPNCRPALPGWLPSLPAGPRATV